MLNSIEMQKMVDHLKTVPHLEQYLKAQMAADKEEFFNATIEAQPVIKGRVARTRSLLMLLEEKDMVEKKKIVRKKTVQTTQLGSRYGI